MTTCKELQTQINDLQRQLQNLESKLDGQGGGCDKSPEWIWDRDAAEKAADRLADAFDWDECPKQPKDFESWGDVHGWLNGLEFK